jgi:hypothetical protein
LSPEIFGHILDKLSFNSRFAFFRSLSDALMPGKDAVLTEPCAETSGSKTQRSIRSLLGPVIGKKENASEAKASPALFSVQQASACRTLTVLT